MAENGESVVSEGASGPVTSEGPTYPQPAYGWYVVVLLTIAYIFSYIDRIVLGLVLEPMKADLGLSDSGMGLLGGAAFAIFYATMGIPLGMLVDRKPRKLIVAAGAILWSLATVFTGMAKSFAQLFIARMAVGFGEAALSPSAMSLISDLFAPERRAKAVAFYSMALGVGSAIAYKTVGWMLEFAATTDLSILEPFGITRPWQFVFLVVGLPGVLLGLVFLTIKEPKRIASKTSVSEDGKQASFGQALKYIWSNRLPLIGVTLMASAMTAVAYTSFWLPALFERTWGWSPATFSANNGNVLIVLAPVSILFWGWLIDHFNQKGRREMPFTVTRWGLFLLVAASAAFPLMPNVWVAFAISQLANIGFTMVTAGGITALLVIIPSEIRGQTVALYYMVISFVGLLIGPSLVPFFTDFVFKDESLLKYSMAIVPLMYSGTVWLFSGMIGRAYRDELTKFVD